LDQACNRSLTRPFHPFACAYAKLSYCAEEQDRFWAANDFLFENGRRKAPVTTKELAGEIDIDFDSLQRCMTSDAAAGAIQTDLEEGRSLGIRGTPTFVIGDRTYPGSIPPEVLAEHLGAPLQ
jgi:protein-disulfide isomerase